MNIETLILWGSAFALLIVFLVPYFLKHQKEQKRVAETFKKNMVLLKDAPVSLHPDVDANQCIGTSNCIKMCPEHDVLGIHNGVATTINPTRCVGHGLCERSCPVDAIQLVIGSAKRGVDIPRIQENFETNVPGIYIVGELGGMGLIRNAFEQARQCIFKIIHEEDKGRASAPDMLDVVIVGCGPAGLAASLNCNSAGLTYKTIEKEPDVGGTVRYYPRKKIVMTMPLDVPGYGSIKFRTVEKEVLIEKWNEIIEQTGILPNIQLGELFETAVPVEGGGFEVKTDKATYRARRVVIAIGRRGVPRKLGVPGENTPKVAYSLLEPEHYQDNNLMVVGGGDSAIESALSLAEQPGNTVWLSYRRDKFSRIKPMNTDRIEAAIDDGSIKFLATSTVVKIEPDKVHVKLSDETVTELPNDQVFVFAGGTLPIKPMKEMGIAIDTKFGSPISGKK